MTLSDTAMMLVDLGIIPGLVTADRAAQIAGRVAQARGADQVGVTVVDEHGHEAPGDVLASPSTTFCVQAIAAFPKGHNVIGTTHPIERDDWQANSAKRYGMWQVIACAGLIVQFAPLTTEEIASCRNV